MSLVVADALGRGGPAAFVMPPDPRVLGTQLHRAAVRFDLSLPSTQVTEPVGLQLR